MFSNSNNFMLVRPFSVLLEKGGQLFEVQILYFTTLATLPFFSFSFSSSLFKDEVFLQLGSVRQSVRTRQLGPFC